MKINVDVPVEQLSLRLRDIIPFKMHFHGISGLSLAIIKNKKITGSLEFGVKNSITQERVNAATVFEGASLSKPLIAYAALKMCRAGLLDIDRPLMHYCSAPYKKNPQHLSQVTLRHILSHSSGFPTHNLMPGEVLKFEFSPGSQWGYSSESFRYLGFVMEHVAKMPLESYMQEVVFQPLGMVSSSFIWQKQYEIHAAFPHDSKGKPVEKWKPHHAVAAFSLHTTSRDYAKFMLEVIKDSQENVQLPNLNMLKSQYCINENLSWGLGWGIEKTSDGDVFWHSGDNGTFKCLALAFRQQEFGIVIMTNSANGFKIFTDILEHSVGGHHHPLIEWEGLNAHVPMDDEFLAQWWKTFQV